VQVHGEDVARAVAGQRVAVNLAGVAVTSVARGDALVGHGCPVRATGILDVALELHDANGPIPRRVQVHHGTRDVPGRLVALNDRYWQLRLEQPLLVDDGDRLVIRRIAPPDTFGGGVVVDAAAQRHGPCPDLVGRLSRIERGEDPDPPPRAPETRTPVMDVAGPPALHPDAVALAGRLLSARHEPPTRAQLGDDARHLQALREAGLAVRIGRDMYAHADAIADVRRRVAAIIRAEGLVTLARLRDELRTSRKFAQALLEHLDADRLTQRRPDDSRVLRRARTG
jgi:selenocysteine-specific elongation factor